jgi:hypothetical protein
MRAAVTSPGFARSLKPRSTQAAACRPNAPLPTTRQARDLFTHLPAPPPAEPPQREEPPPPPAAAPGRARPAQSLAALAARVLGVDLDKGQQLSDWGAPRLSPEQLAYAAADAWAGRQLALAAAALAERAAAAAAAGDGARGSDVSSQAGPDQPAPAAGPAAGGSFPAAAVPHAVRFLAGFARNFTPPAAAGGGEQGLRGEPRGAERQRRREPEGVRQLGEEWVERQRAKWAGLKPAKIPVKKGPAYDNARIQAPDGTVLCTCGRRCARRRVAKEAEGAAMEGAA